MNIIQLKDGNCWRCDGGGYIADDSDGTPWKYWMEMPRQSTIAIDMGLVKPVVCDECNGTGDSE